MELRGATPPELPAALAQVDRLEGTIGTLLMLARDAPRTAGATPLRPALDETETRWRGPLAAQGRPLRVWVEPGELATAMPAAVLREILDVLLDNAYRHGAGAVSVRLRRVAGGLALDVADEGPGITLSSADLFARRAGSGDGHGIGLALARSLAHAEAGRLTLSKAQPPCFTMLLALPANPTGDGASNQATVL